jgi:hypothetical protein
MASSGGDVAARCRENAEGEKTAREEAGKGAIPLLAAPERKHSGEERKATRGCSGKHPFPGQRERANTSEASREAKAREGAKKPTRSLAPVARYSASLANLRRGGAAAGDGSRLGAPAAQTFEAARSIMKKSEDYILEADRYY